MEESWIGAKELAVRVNCAREELSEPVEGGGVKDVANGWGLVSPLLVFFANPG